MRGLRYECRWCVWLGLSVKDAVRFWWILIGE